MKTGSTWRTLPAKWQEVYQCFYRRTKKGVSKGGKTTKIHLTTDKFGRPIRINLSAENINYSVVFEKQIAGKADRAYSTYNIIENLSVNGAVICINEYELHLEL